MIHCVQKRKTDEMMNTEHRSDPFQRRSQTEVRNKLEWAWYSAREQREEEKNERRREIKQKSITHTHTHTLSATHYVDWYTVSTRARSTVWLQQRQHQMDLKKKKYTTKQAKQTEENRQQA